MALLFGNPQYATDQWLFGDPSNPTIGFSATAPETFLKLHSVCAGAARAPGGFLDNDVDAAGNPFSYSLESGVSHGTLATYLGGAFDYIPAPGFVGQDSFTYRAWAGCQPGNLATVTINVEGAFSGVAAATRLRMLASAPAASLGFSATSAAARLRLKSLSPLDAFGAPFDEVAGDARLALFFNAGTPAFGIAAVSAVSRVRVMTTRGALDSGFNVIVQPVRLAVRAAAGLLDFGGATTTTSYHVIKVKMNDRGYIR